MGILEDILARLERIESAVSADQKAQAPAEHYAPATPVPAPAPVQTAPAPQPNYGAPAPAPTTTTQVAGPTAVPTFQELMDRLLTLNQAKGEMPCLDLLRSHGGQDAEGSVNLKLVPEANYAALYQAIGQALGVH